MIPAAKQAVVARALQQAFGTTDIDDIRPETGGLSGALIFRIVVKGAPYLLRVVTRDAVWQSPSNEFSSMQKAADAGIAPRIRYANAQDRVLISDFVESQPFPEDLATRIAPVLRTLHALPKFPHPSTGPYLDFVDRLVREFRAAGFLPAHRTDELLDRYARVTEVYPRNDDLVSSHNDLKPDNFLFDGDRVWLVDWEAAFLNDRFVDLAMVANFFVTSEAEEEAYLEAYFGEPASDDIEARFYLMRQTVHLAYLTFLFPVVVREGGRIEPDVIAPDFGDFHQRLRSGEVSLATVDGKLEYALAHMEQGLREMRSPRFDDALARVARTAKSERASRLR